ncbi:MAG TPA: vanadium-dependent haloperoxidase [Longimicrobiaceae bacterium]|nr:vanadium-dependent haloperoxidase [Longimicrobiaceae bacterium]
MADAHTFTDGFDGTSLDSSKWDWWGPVSQSNGRIWMQPLANGSDNWTGMSSDDKYDLTDSHVTVELVQALYGRGIAYFDLFKDGDNWIEIAVEEGLILVVKEVGGVETTLSDAPYDPVAHRFLRLRHRSAVGQVFWEASPDGKHWTTLYAEAAPFAVTNVGVELGVGVDSPDVAVFDNLNMADTGRSRRVEERRLSALAVREEAAGLAASRAHAEHFNNNDEVRLPRYIGNYSKSLAHDSVGDPDPVSYGSLLRALQSQDPGDFEEIILGRTDAKPLTNPQAGLAFDLEGPDAQELTMPPAPRFDGAQQAHEAGELYWMAVARDVPFINYGSDALISEAVGSLNSEFPKYGGPSPVTVQNVFRGIYKGERVGPYVSQFLLKGNADPRKPDGTGRDANEGYVTYGIQRIDQRLLAVKPGVDYLTSFSDWLAVQNGRDDRGNDQFDGTYRFIRSLRDGANYVHFDQVVNAFWNAAFILMAEPTGNQLSGVGAGRPQVDLEFPLDQGNPYDPPGTALDSRTQVGFCTFGPEHLLQTLIEVAGRACRAVWWQKWGVHRRLRPEEFGGRVDNQLAGRRTYPIEASILNSLKTGALEPYYGSSSVRFPGFLLPQAYPEGAPTHPAYGAGHATISGACATILKAFFDESKTIENPVQASADGTALVAYTGTDATQMTVGSELNKLSANISLFRNAAGVHWRTEDTFSRPLGEAIAIRLLQEQSLTFNEDNAFFQLTRLDGTTIRIFDGCVVIVG